jgi:hypothetical protein
MNRAESAGKRSSPTAIRNGRLKSTPAVCVQAAAINRSFFVLATELSLPDVRRSKSVLSAAKFEDVADALAFALRFQSRKRVHNADELMSAIVAKRLVEHLERSGFVIMKRPPIGGAAALGRGHGAR